jgi:HD-like signal output (HDOD) protein/CheY-like chemotaxis protein
VELASNGAEGLERALKSPPHVILTDIRMPELDGHTFLRRLAGRDLDSAIVVMSAHGDMADVVEVMRQGAIDYLTKPWTPSELAAALARANEIYRKRRALRGRAPGAEPAPASSPAPAGDPVFAQTLERLRRGDVVLPSTSPVVAELRRVAADADASVDAVAEVIARDPRTTMQVLRLANSAQYARHGRTNDVAGAVQRVGLTHIVAIAETLHTHACFEVRDPQLAPLQKQIWQHSVARAVSMRALAELAQTELDPETAYCAGLFVDAGASFLIWLAAQRSSTPDPAACLAAVRAQHAELGALLLERWSMDPAIVFVAAHHHDESPPAPRQPYWPLAILAGELAEALNSQDLTRTAALDSHLVDRCAAELGIGATLLNRIRARLAPELEAILDSV